MTGEIGVLYERAKDGHTKGIALLVRSAKSSFMIQCNRIYLQEREFGYHPAFKRPEDTFTASAFRPK